MYLCVCVILLVPYSLENHAQLRGGSVAERLRSTLAYGWVECCSDIAGCGTSSYKISNLVYFTPAIILLLMNMVNMLNECLYECMLLLVCMINNYICVCSTSMHFVQHFLNSHVHGASRPDG